MADKKMRGTHILHVIEHIALNGNSYTISEELYQVCRQNNVSYRYKIKPPLKQLKIRPAEFLIQQGGFSCSFVVFYLTTNETILKIFPTDPPFLCYAR